MKTFKEIKESDTAVFTFGRFNPPTTGHEKLIDALAKEQVRTPECSHVCVSISFPEPKERPTSSWKKSRIHEEDVSKV